jgi:hypothetical protein
VGVLVAVAVSVGVLVAVAVSVGVFVGVLVGVFVGVLVGVAVSVGVLFGVFVGVWVAVSVGVFVGVWVAVSVGVLVGVGVHVAHLGGFCRLCTHPAVGGGLTGAGGPAARASGMLYSAIPITATTTAKPTETMIGQRVRITTSALSEAHVHCHGVEK